MMIAGTYEVTIDDKGRVTLPAKYRTSLETEGGAVLVRLRGRDSCVRVYHPDAWAEFERRYLDPLDEFGNPGDSWIRRDIYANLQQVTPDKAGRVLVPRTMAEDLGLAGRLKIVGNKDHLEIWNPETYESERTRRGPE